MSFGELLLAAVSSLCRYAQISDGIQLCGGIVESMSGGECVGVVDGDGIGAVLPGYATRRVA